jgi:sec-independent protein translocase protein TatA
MIPHFSLGELLVLLLVVLLIFGPKRLPDLASSLGKSIRLFKDGMNNQDSETHDAKKPDSPK